MDGSGPQRANAAQMAQRQIKAMKGRSGNRPRAGPVQSPSPAFGQSQSAPAAQPFQFQPPNGTSGGGGAFNFSFGGSTVNNPFANTGASQVSANDERRDPAEERDRKRTSMQGSDGDSVPLFAPIPQGTSNLFGSSQLSNGAAQGGGIFSTSNGFGGGMNMAQPQPPTTSTSFGGFGQGQASNNIFNNGQTSSGSFNFNFGGSSQPTQPTSSSFTFGQTTTQPKSAGFQFGATPATEAPATNLFGTSQPPSTNLFGTSSQTPSSSNGLSNVFGKKESSPAPSSNLFGATAQAQPSNPFSTSTPATTNVFGSREASPAPPTNSTNLFGTNAQSSTPNPFGNTSSTSDNIFGKKADATPAPPTPAQNIFGSATQNPPPSGFSASTPAASNIFASKPATPAASEPAKPADQEQPKPSTNNLFGHQDKQQAGTTNTSTLFGSFGQSSSPSPSLFGEKNAEPAGNPFANLNKPSSSESLFKAAEQQPAPTSTLFGTPKQSTADLFGNLNKPVDSTVTDPKPPTTSLFGQSSAQKPASTSFGQSTGSTNGFAFNNTSTPTASSTNLTSSASQEAQKSTPLFSFGSQAAPPPPAPQPSKATLFSPLKPSETLSGPSKGLFSGPQGSVGQESLQTLPSTTSMEKTVDGELIGDAIRRIADTDPQQAPKHDGTDLRDLSIASQITDEYMKDLIPEGFTADQRQDFYCAYRIRALNRAMAMYFGGLQSAGDPVAAMKFYLAQRTTILTGVKARNSKFAAIQRAGQNNTAPNQSKSVEGQLSAPSALFNASSPLKSQSAAEAPTPRINGNTSSLAAAPPLTPAPAPSPQKSSTAPPTGGKRKAEDNLDKDNADQINKRPMRKIATPSQTRPAASPSSGSTTSNIFKNILDSPSKSSEQSPTKKTASLPGGVPASTSDTPKVNPFGSLFVPKSPSKPESTSTPKKQDEPQKTTGLSTPSTSLFGFKPTETAKSTGSNPFGATFSPAATSSTPTTSGGFRMPGGTSGNGINFAAQFGSNANDDDEAKALKEAIDKDYDSEEEKLDDFKARWKKARQERIEKYASASSTAKTTFSFGSTVSSTTPASQGGFKMPSTVGTGASFSAQFGSNTNDDDEAKALKEAIDKDYDSEEENLEEFKAKWKKARQERINQYAAAANTSKTTFSFTPEPSAGANKPAQSLFGSSTASQTKSSDVAKSTEAPQPSKPLFSFGAATQSNNGFLSPANISRASTASPAPSASGSVLDNHAPGKPVTFGNNIFGHLSGGESGRSDDADDENGDDAESESDPEIDADSENKDPNYTPGRDSGPGTPVTPAEETGAGIASAKKSALFNFPPSKGSSIFGGSPSGTSTPGGSLFGRITRDTSAKPTAASSEEKENTQPTGTGLFAALNKSHASPVDQTWKIDSPIKFGNTTSSNDSKASTPTVNVTSATPTKPASTPSLFANLNNSGGPTSAPFSNLFGSSSTPKPAAPANLGFNIGGVSNTSSLFPSATTSRATTPGATTDGDSAAEDPDAEKQEQISLTSGGAGEEDEDVKFEVRVKAQLFSQKEGAAGSWEVKGLGPLRVLKHKESAATRVLLRAEPRGNLVLNKSILGKFKYEASGKTVKFVAIGENGKGLETWLLQVKTVESAKELAEALEANKSE